MTIPIVDLFAGPGGLNEGFSGYSANNSTSNFETIASFEMDASACETLALRETYRQLRPSGVGLESYYRLIRGEATIKELECDPAFSAALTAARAEIHCLELGPESRRETNDIIRKALKGRGIKADTPWVLVGGPPCQAYSIAGRSRRVNDETFEDDKKHFLYREYLNILSTFQPPIFVMENVKGLLSSTHAGTGMFDRILRDLSEPSKGVSYSIHSLTKAGRASSFRPEDFIIRSEDFGVPQRRHRVILLGIRSDLDIQEIPKLHASEVVNVRDAIEDLPALRSGVSKGSDDPRNWLAIRKRAADMIPHPPINSIRNELSRGAAWYSRDNSEVLNSKLARWLHDPNLHGVAQHTTRGHMAEDLIRYWFAASFATQKGYSPKLGDFPTDLLPRHANILSENRPFQDRFRVQVWDRPATTVVSHIAKDGHYYIHPDPYQMRSLTVREAARLQTFPDNYVFMGNRTSQFTQVGNAVPPLLAHQIADVVSRIIKSI